MFFLNTKLHKNSNLILTLKPLYSYGLYWRRFLNLLFRYHPKGTKEFFKGETLAFLKYYLINIFNNIELEGDVKEVQIQVKKSLQTYQGLRLQLSLPVRGQRTWTNASTQWLLSIPRKRHFVQKRNRWKFAQKEVKRTILKTKTTETTKNDKK